MIYYNHVDIQAAAAKPKISFLSNFPPCGGGSGGSRTKNEWKFLGFAPRELVERGRGAKGQPFSSKCVRAELYNSTKMRLSEIFPIFSFARSAKECGGKGFPRASRASKRRFDITCDFKYLLCPIIL